jgi:glycosyltransferase involved in cell wall biosynthesis
LSLSKKILFLSFNPIFSIGGHSKNFLNLIKHIEPQIKKNNYKAYIISYNNTPQEKAENLDKISKTIFLKSYNITMLKRVFPSGRLLYQVLEYTLNLIKTSMFIMNKKPDLIYAYADKPMYIASRLKKFFDFKLIYDIRGDILDEHKARGASKRKLSKLSKFHIKALNSVDVAFTVSSTYKINSKAEFIPKFNYYDGEIFKYDEELMLVKKKDLQLDDKFVFVYTGNSHYYQYLEGIVKFFSQFLQKNKDSFFIIITEHDTSAFVSLLNKHNIPRSSYSLASLPQEKISDLQQAADMGFLLREDLPLNHHSFPTKFAEYLASGVPVLMTPYIHSISPMVAENGLGEVIKIKDDYSAEIEQIYSKYKGNLEIKKHCSDFAQSELMWQNKAVSIFNIIDDMIR